MKLKFTLTRPELSKAFRTFAWQGRGYRIALAVFSIAFVMIAIASDVTHAIPILLIATGVFTAVMCVPVLLWRSSEDIRSEQNLVMDQNNFMQKLKNDEAKLQWNYFKSVIETSQFYLLCKDRRLFVTVPKRAFSNAEEDKRFRELLTENGLI